MKYTYHQLSEDEEIDVGENVGELYGVYDDNGKLVCVTSSSNAEEISREWSGHAPFAPQLKAML